MAAGKLKQFLRPPPKKKPPRAAALDSVDDFQEAADFEEQAGGKHRVGDPVKSGRAFARALEIYDKGLQKHPKSFDLAYNKSRLQLEISQQPNLVEHIGLSLVDWLQITLESHRHALKLDDENPDVLFNTAQVLSSLAEQLSEEDEDTQAVKLLQEALELLSSCLARQEIMFEQHRLDFPDTEDGGVPLDGDAQEKPPASVDADVDMEEQQSAIVETPLAATDLLDTVQASLSALTTLASLADESGLQALGDMAHSLTESKAPQYLQLVPGDEQDKARLFLALHRAIFIAAYASRQFELRLIELQTYLERLDTFDIPGKDGDASLLCAEAQARTEFVLSAIDRYDESASLPATICWRQLSQAQDLYTRVTKLSTEDALERKAEVYASKGDVELLRHRLVTMPQADLGDGIRKSAPTLIQNAQTYYKGAVSLARSGGDEDVEEEAQQRWDVAGVIAARLHGGGNGGSGVGGDAELSTSLMEALGECVDQGLLSARIAQTLVEGGDGGGGGASRS